MERKQAGVKLFDCISSDPPAGGDDSDIDLETGFIFDNQWNTTDGRRVFDWYESIVPNRRIKIGHYLTITPAMVEIRRNTFKCGYCGKEYYGTQNAGRFCPACLDSPYLKQDDLRLLRVLPAGASFNGSRPELTPEESAIILPDYVRRQTRGTSSRAARKHREEKQDILKDYRKTVTTARHEKDGLLWLYKQGISLDNVIYYNHTDTFCFGWRQPITSFDVYHELERLLVNFPFKWEIKQGRD
jgi:hypothetical protein